MLDVALANRARAATIAETASPEQILAVREGSVVRAEMAKAVQEAWEEDTSSVGKEQVPLPERCQGGVTRRLLLAAQRTSAEYGPSIARKKQALDPSYYRRVRTPVFRVGARISGEEEQGSLYGLPLDGVPEEEEEEGEEVDEDARVPRGEARDRAKRGPHHPHRRQVV